METEIDVSTLARSYGMNERQTHSLKFKIGISRITGAVRKSSQRRGEQQETNVYHLSCFIVPDMYVGVNS